MTKQKEWINPNLYTGDPNNMGLGDYCHALGDEAGHQMCRDAGVPHTVMKNIENGHPIAAVYLDRIAQWLSRAYSAIFNRAISRMSTLSTQAGNYLHQLLMSLHKLKGGEIEIWVESQILAQSVI